VILTLLFSPKLGIFSIAVEKNLVVIKPLLSVLAEPLYTIEPATLEETKKAEKRIREYHKALSSFVPFKKRVAR
jgi:hypothetical protein